MAIRRDGLAARREALGYTQETFAQALARSVEPSTVGRWERGTLTPQPWRRRNLAKLLELSLDELDALLTSPSAEATAGRSLPTRREVMVDAALLTGAVIVGQVAGRPVEKPALVTADMLADASTVAGAAVLVASVHQAYQAARYTEVTHALPSVTAAVDVLIAEGKPGDRRNALALRSSVSIAASKLATKERNAEVGRNTAELARETAAEAEDVFGQAAAAYQLTCARLRADESEPAEELAVNSAAAIRGADPQSLTWRGALTLISSIIAARRGDTAEADARLNHADELARRLGADANIGWTAFGPTNVMIHRLSAARALDNPYGALAIAERIDITALPQGLHGRQAEFHLNSAWAHSQLGEDPQAVIHLLDTERVAPDLVRANPNTHILIRDLMSRERRRAVPGLRGLALRAGVAAV